MREAFSDAIAAFNAPILASTFRADSEGAERAASSESSAVERAASSTRALTSARADRSLRWAWRRSFWSFSM
eukprot:scaffold252076_cov27-Tisochrysis_lutea.AAC.1